MNGFYKLPVRIYDDGHKCEEFIPGEFKQLKNISDDMYSSIDLVIRDDGMIGLIEEHEVSGMNNPKNGGSRFEFVEIGSIEDLNEYVNERFPGWFKLIDYLNEEFDEKFSDLDEGDKEDNHFTYQMGLDEVHICSKKDGHIKWLYDKGYIDKEKISPLVTKAFAYVQWEGNIGSLLDDLYAYLAVCDEPLKDLASVLK